jgi:Ca2+-binding EF-hand superfamily protein
MCRSRYGFIDDQNSALLMMATSVLSNGVGMLADMYKASVPLILVCKTVVEFLLSLIIMILPTIWTFLGVVHKKIVRPRIPAPPPVWTLIKSPPPIVDLIAKLLHGHLLNLLGDVIQDIAPMITVYMKEFAKHAADWMQKFGDEELDKQFSEVFDSAHPRKAIELAKFIRKFHRKACIRTMHVLAPKLKDLAQGTINEATAIASKAAEKSRAISSGEDLGAAAGAVFSPNLIKKLTDLTGALGPVLANYAKKAVAKQVEWLKAEGQNRIDEARGKLEDVADTGDFSSLGDGPDIGDSPTLDISLSMEFDAISDKARFSASFADDLVQCLSGLTGSTIDKNRIGVQEVRTGGAGTTRVKFGFTPDGSPAGKELIATVLNEVFQTPADELPGCLQNLLPDIPVPELTKNAMLQHVCDEHLKHAFVQSSWSVFDDVALPAVQAYRRKATKASDEWVTNDVTGDAVPTSEFHKKGLREAYNRLAPLMDNLRGEAGNRAQSIHIEEEDRSTDMHRKISQVISELVWEQVEAKCMLELGKKLDTVALDSIILKNRLKMKAHAAMEQLTRADIYRNFVEKTSKIDKRLLPKGRECLLEPGSEQAVDACGYLVNRGGWSSVKAEDNAMPMVLGMDPKELADNLIDDETVEKLEELFASLEPVFLVATQTAVGAMKEWNEIRHQQPELSNLESELTLVTRIPGLSKIKGFMPGPLASVAGSTMGLVMGGPKSLLKLVPGSKQAKQLASALGLKTATADESEDEVEEETLMVPTPLFIKMGTAAAVEQLRPTIDELGGVAAERTETFTVSLDQRSTDCRRTLDKILQELVVAKAKQEVFPELVTRLAELDLPTPVAAAVKQQVHNLAEEDLRRCTHIQVLAFWDQINNSVQVKGGTPEEEAGADADEDEFGFTLAEGGYAGFRASQGSPDMDLADMFSARGIDPMTQVDLLLGPLSAEFSMPDPDSGDSDNQLFAPVASVMKSMYQTVNAAKDQWALTPDGKKTLKASKKAATRAKKAAVREEKRAKKAGAKVDTTAHVVDLEAADREWLEKHSIPTNDWIKLGLNSALRHVRPMLEQALPGNERVATLLQNFGLPATQSMPSPPPVEAEGDEAEDDASGGGRQSVEQHTNDMRRSLSMLLQELLSAKLKEKVLPAVEENVRALNLPLVMIEDKVLRMARDGAERTLRQNVHTLVSDGMAEAIKAVQEPGAVCTHRLDAGDELEEDECGFLVSEGGYRAFCRANGSSIVDQVDDLKMEIVSLEQAVNDIATGEHYWRKIFDTIKPGDVLTVDDFRFNLHQAGLRLTDKQFTALVKKIDDDGDGAISYDEFMDYFVTEQGELHAQSLTTESELARSVWDKLDTDKSGHLCMDEVKALFKRLGQKKSKHQLKVEFDAMDQDGDGEIDYTEFAAWWHKQHEDEVGSVARFQQKADFFRNVWDEADIDGDGRLCQEEMRSLFDKMGRKLSKKKFIKAFSKMDVNGDGSIDYSEFVEWMHKQSEFEFSNFRHFEDYADDAEEARIALEKKTKELAELTKQMIAEMPTPDVSDIPGGAGALAAGGAAVAGVVALGIDLPVMDFQMDAIDEAFGTFHEKLANLHGIVGDKAKEIAIAKDMAPHEKLRAFSQLLQVKVIQLAREKMVPVIDKAVEAVDLPGRLIVKKVRAIVYELAEKEVRTYTHSMVLTQFNNVTDEVSIPGCTTVCELEEDDQTDDCGYLKDLGGYKAADFPLVPKASGENKQFAEYTNKVIDPVLMQQVKDQMGIVAELMENYVSNATEASTTWMDETGSAEIAEAKEKAVLFRKEGKEGQSERELLAMVQIPTCNHHIAGLRAAITSVKPMMVDTGGLVAEYAEKIPLDEPINELKSIHLRRGLSQMVQEFVMSKMTIAVYPTVAKRLHDLNLVGPIASKVRTIVYQMLEDIVRSTVFDQIATAFGKIEVNMRVQGCGVVDEMLSKKKEAEDEFGWLVKQGGWKKERARRIGAGIGAGSPTEAVSGIFAEMKDTLLSYTGEAGATVEVFISETRAAQKEWMESEGIELIKKGKGVPVARFLSVGLRAALEFLREQLEAVGGALGKLAEQISELPKDGVHELIRALDQFVQHLVMDKVSHLVFPELESQFADIDMARVPAGLIKKARDMLFSLSEEVVRKGIHQQVRDAFKSLQEDLVVPGCKALIKKPKEEEDEFGWPKTSPYKVWRYGKNATTGVMDFVNTIIDPSVQSKLEKVAGEATPILKKYTAETKRALSKWEQTGAVALADTTSATEAMVDPLEPEPEVELPVDAAAGIETPMELEGVSHTAKEGQIPIADIQKAGLRVAIDELRPILESLHESTAERAAEIQTSVADRSTDMRRALDQLLQELAVAKAKVNIFPMLDQAIAKNPRLRGPLRTKVQDVVHDMAEGITRKQMHQVTLTSFKQVNTASIPTGLEAAIEPGQEQEEDEYGFLVAEGGYKQFKGAAASKLVRRAFPSFPCPVLPEISLCHACSCQLRLKRPGRTPSNISARY